MNAANHPKPSPASQGQSGLFAVGWLFLLHALADLFAAVYRCHDVAPHVTDVLAAGLPRAQLCLLALWLAAGKERLSWRICGLIAGGCFLFTVFSRLLFPGRPDIGAESIWMAEQWVYYFRPSGPGDLLVKSPVLIGGVALPILAWRMGRGIRELRRDELSIHAIWSRHWLQFRIQDLAIWFAAICLALAAIYNTAPHPGWFGNLYGHAREIWRMGNPATQYSMVSALLYVWLTVLAVWSVYGKGGWYWRLPVVGMLTVTPAYVLERWLQQISQDRLLGPFSTIWYQTVAETAMAAVALIALAGSLWLVRVFANLHGPKSP